MQEVKTQYQIRSKTCMQQELLDTMNKCLVNGTSPSVIHNNNDNTIPNTVVYLRDYGKSTEPAWKEFEVPLLVEFTQRHAHHQTCTTGKRGSYTIVLDSYCGQSRLAIQIAKDE